ncbi:hypothetical protein Hanom_Chr12g01121921 [Helianthus anomalus]
MRDDDEVITLWSYFRQRLAGGDIFFSSAQGRTQVFVSSSGPHWVSTRNKFSLDDGSGSRLMTLVEVFKVWLELGQSRFRFSSVKTSWGNLGSSFR